MDKKAEILDRAARMAVIRSNVEKAGIEKNANWLTQTIKTTKGRGKGATKVDPKEGWSPMKLLGVVAAGVIMNQFIQKLIAAGERAGIRMKGPIYYKKMLEENPQLMEAEEDDVLRLWETLYKSAPHLAEDPVAAGGFITQNLSSGIMNDFGSPPMDTYKTLISMEKDLQNNRDSGAANAFGSIAGALSAGAISS